MVHITDTGRQHRLPPRGVDRSLFTRRSTYRGILMDDPSTMEWTCIEEDADYNVLSGPESFIGGKCDRIATVFRVGTGATVATPVNVSPAQGWGPSPMASPIDERQEWDSHFTKLRPGHGCFPAMEA